MTKILYVPTGLFLEFNTCAENEKRNCDVELCGIPNIDDLILEILSLRDDNVYNNISNVKWARNNNMQLPVLREELEIVYD